MSIAIEAAELMEIFQWLSNEEAWDIKNSQEFTHLKEELGRVRQLPTPMNLLLENIGHEREDLDFIY